ncbi:hypothetical protein PFISCL1PPCAC_818, partial [Pristionchus fissidentatus]
TRNAGVCVFSVTWAINNAATAPEEPESSSSVNNLIEEGTSSLRRVLKREVSTPTSDDVPLIKREIKEEPLDFDESPQASALGGGHERQLLGVAPPSDQKTDGKIKKEEPDVEEGKEEKEKKKVEDSAHSGNPAHSNLRPLRCTPNGRLW